ncbi:MAG TPA: hypothetical protein PK843_00365 [bacterium]|nr:hypothetical protein [bacterium]HPN32937.1 hypothetical protein [bacterium]
MERLRHWLCMLLLLSCTKAEKKMVSDDNLHWLQSEARRQLLGCRIEATDGTTLFTPDGEGHYAALWTRDLAYMVENGFDLFTLMEIKKAILYLLAGQRSDGCIPDRRQADGLAVYSAGPANHPLGDPPTDNSQFMVKLMADYVDRSGDMDFFIAHSAALIRAMDYTPRSSRGLVHIDPLHPHSPYGFTDTIQKTGELLFSSLLYWEASQRLATLFDKCRNPENAQTFRSRARLIEQHADALWDEASGMFFAASQDCRQIDIWGNAYAVYIAFPLGDKKTRIVRYLADHFDRYVYSGQIRHLPEPEVWEKTLIPVKAGAYQNGAYWGTASGWVAVALAEQHPQLSQRIFEEMIEDYRTHGPHECCNRGYRQLNNYVVSVLNPLGALRRGR